jgi:hypothetical protein
LPRGGRNHGERVEREPTGGLGAEPPVGSRAPRGPGAKPLVGGQGGEAPLKLKAFYMYEGHNLLEFCILCALFHSGYTLLNNTKLLQDSFRNAIIYLQINCHQKLNVVNNNT